MSKTPKKWLAILLLLASTLTGIEVLAYLMGKYLEGRDIFYRPYVTETYEEYMARRDPDLGWPSRNSFGMNDLDASGSRIIPAFPDPRAYPACVSLYGDSFTWGSEVNHAHAWSNVLAKLLGCRVANYGIPAYGTDQAYLRFHLNTHDRAPVVIMGYLSENITRNVGQFRNLVTAMPQFLLKPRYILDARGELQLIPITPLSAEEFQDLNDHPDRYLTHEFFLPGGISGVQRLQFPYFLSILRLYRRFYIKQRLLGQPHYADFYNPDHPAGGLQITVALLRRFHQEALDRGQWPLVVIFPMQRDFYYYQRSHRWVYASLVSFLSQSGVEFLNMGECLLPYLDWRDPRNLYGVSHFNEEGNRLTAEIIFSYIQGKGLLASPSQAAWGPK